jgi:hypothetical protein
MTAKDLRFPYEKIITVSARELPLTRPHYNQSRQSVKLKNYPEPRWSQTPGGIHYYASARYIPTGCLPLFSD